jgi:nucleoside-diphosphate-sugar epimerase
MRIFLTGATGYIGSAVLDGLVRAGHQITALVRSPSGAETVASRGATPVLGDLRDAHSYATAAEGFDAYIHTGAEVPAQREVVDRQSLDVLLHAAKATARSSNCVFLYTSGTWVLGSNANPVDETAQINPTPLVAWRPAHERTVLETADARLRTAVIRPATVYGGSRGTISELLKNAMNGIVRVVGDGENHWPLVYQRDVADLYVRVIADGSAAGVFHAADESDETVNQIVDGIRGHFSIPPDVRHVPLAEARPKMGLHADALVLDLRVRCPRARAIGWVPALTSVSRNIPRLLEEFRRGQERAA